MGRGGVKVEKGLLPGSETIQLEVAPAGHIVLPCCEYKNSDGTNNSSLTLMTRLAHPDSAAGKKARAARVPPPPDAPPRFPEELRRNIDEIDPALTLEAPINAPGVRLPLASLLTGEEGERLNLRQTAGGNQRVEAKQGGSKCAWISTRRAETIAEELNPYFPKSTFCLMCYQAKQPHCKN